MSALVSMSFESHTRGISERYQALCSYYEASFVKPHRQGHFRNKDPMPLVSAT